MLFKRIAFVCISTNISIQGEIEDKPLIMWSSISEKVEINIYLKI